MFCLVGHLLSIDTTCDSAGGIELPLPVATTTTPYPLSEFHCFPLLPSELRFKIWKMNFPEPRLMRPRYVMDDGSNTLYSYIEPANNPYISRLLPSMLDLLLINKEASQIFKESYIRLPVMGTSIAKLWESDAEDERSGFGGMTTIVEKHDYVDKLRDTLYLEEHFIDTLGSLSAWVDFSQIRRLALELHVDSTSPVAGYSREQELKQGK